MSVKAPTNQRSEVEDEGGAICLVSYRKLEFNGHVTNISAAYHAFNFIDFSTTFLKLYMSPSQNT